MTAGVPLVSIIGQILSHTPRFVWALLLALVGLGLMQWREQRVARARLLIAPVALGALSLWGVSSAFGARPEVLGAWLLGVALALLANRALQWPRSVRREGDTYVVAGSGWPLVLMMAIFLLRYAVAVTLVFHRDWATDAEFSGAMALLYGMLSGLFTARAVRILQSGRPPRAANGVAALRPH